ncbi:MAG: hypothetical protein Q4D94_13355 [Bacillota bacterium]|nr:hypothetical protein [Bacillota bacterium]
MKKKVLFMALAAAVMLTACGGNKDADGADVETTVTDEAPEEDAASVEDEAPAADETEAEDEAVQEPEAEEDAADEESAAGEFVRGIQTETGWESEYLGLRFTTPDDMVMASDEELAEMLGIGTDALSDAGDFSDAQLKLAELTSVYEMFAYDALGNNVNVTVEKTPVNMSAEDYMDALSQTLLAITAISYEQVSEPETVELGGVEYVKSSFVGTTNGQTMNQDYYVRIVDNMPTSIIVSYSSDDAAAKIADAFGAY